MSQNFSAGQSVLIPTGSGLQSATLIESYEAGSDVYWIAQLNDGTQTGVYQSLLESTTMEPAPQPVQTTQNDCQCQETAEAADVEEGEVTEYGDLPEPEFRVLLHSIGPVFARCHGYIVRVVGIQAYEDDQASRGRLADALVAPVNAGMLVDEGFQEDTGLCCAGFIDGVETYACSLNELERA